MLHSDKWKVKIEAWHVQFTFDNRFLLKVHGTFQ